MVSPARGSRCGGQHLERRTGRKCAISSLCPPARCPAGSLPPTDSFVGQSGTNVEKSNRASAWQPGIASIATR